MNLQNRKSIDEIYQIIINALILAFNENQPDASKQITDLENSPLKSLSKAVSLGIDINNDFTAELLKQIFPTTATGEFLNIWLSIFGINKHEGATASGLVDFTGVTGSVIPAGTALVRADGLEYSVKNDATVLSYNLSVSGIERLGSVATATVSSTRGLATGMNVTISGCDQSEYNIGAIITVISDTQFTYIVAGSPTTPATGTIAVSFTSASVEITANSLGSAYNSIGGSNLQLVSPLNDIDTKVFVEYNGISGGYDEESEDSARNRMLERLANMTNVFSPKGLEIFIKNKFQTITRIWVKRSYPEIGKVSIFFVQDKEASIIPNALTINNVFSEIINPENKIVPANTPVDYILVSAPQQVVVDFNFISLSPNTEAMRSAISSTLKDYFRSSAVQLETNISSNEYNSLIYSIIDADGNSPTFSLLSPSGDIGVGDDSLAILGNITFPA